jgi:hypothetical protein
MVNMSKVRDVLKIGGTILAMLGVGDAATWGQAADLIMTIGGAGTALVGIVWTHFASTPKAVVAEAAQTVPVPVDSQRQVGIQVPVRATNPQHGGQ